MSKKLSAKNFMGTILVNIDNPLLTDKAFRKLIRNSLPIVEKPELEEIIHPEMRKNARKYYE